MLKAKRSNNKAAYIAALFFYLRRSFILFLFIAILSFFVWVAIKSTHPCLPSEKRPLILYSNQCKDDLKLVYLRAIESANSSLFLVIYGLTAPDIIKALQKKIEEGIVVRVFYDTGGSKGIESHLPKEVAFPIKSSGLMHKKIRVFMGSANLTESSLHMHDNLVLGCYHKGLSTFLQTSLDPSYQFTIQGQDLELWSLPEQEKKAIGRILDEINKAKNSLRVCMFTFTSKEIANALLEAKKRGVKIEVAFDFYSARGASKQNLETLQKENIATFTSKGGKLLHHKWCLIDEKTLILGSTNWTGSAFSKNDDCLIFLEGLLPQQIQMMETIWNTLDLD